MSAHEFHGHAPSRAGRKQSKLGPGIIELDKLEELLRAEETEAWFIALGRRAGPDAEAKARAVRRASALDKQWCSECHVMGPHRTRDHVYRGGATGGENDRP